MKLEIQIEWNDLERYFDRWLFEKSFVFLHYDYKEVIIFYLNRGCRLIEVELPIILVTFPIQLTWI